MADTASAGTKRKKPPTFQHFPINRAKVLKKAWVEKTKIKSKWKAEKRKEGLASSSRIELPEYSDQEDNDDGGKGWPSEGPTNSADGEKEVAVPSSVAEREAEPSKPHLHPSRAHIHPEHPVKRSTSTKSDPASRPSKRQKISKQKEVEQAVEPPSLRDLTREAYSRSTLHTFKSDPLKKRRVIPDRGDKNSNRRRHEAVTGRGQPNMKLRMNAMLEKIKQDFA